MAKSSESNSSTDALLALASREKTPRGIRIDVSLADNRSVAVYAGQKVAAALASVTAEMTVWEGVKLIQVIEAVYEQGRKDGARHVFETVDTLKMQIPHRNPGQPKKLKKSKKQKKKSA